MEKLKEKQNRKKKKKAGKGKENGPSAQALAQNSRRGKKRNALRQSSPAATSE